MMNSAAVNTTAKNTMLSVAACSGSSGDVAAPSVTTTGHATAADETSMTTCSNGREAGPSAAGTERGLAASVMEKRAFA
jgi:hypothetical protein